MRTYSRILAVLLALVLCLGVAVLPAAAATANQDGLEITLTTDKSSYKKDESIQATLVVKNNGDQTVTDVALKDIIPAGYELKSGDKSVLEVEELAPGETVTLKVTFMPKKPAASSPATGDSAALMPALMLMLVSAAGLIVLAVKGQWKKILSLVLCVSMVLSLFAGVPLGAKAAEAEAKTLDITHTIKVSGQNLTLKATVSYKIEKPVETTEPEEPTEVTEPEEVTQPTEPVTVFAVSFVTGGGSAVETQYVPEGATAVRPADSVLEGYVFLNWYADEALTVLYDFAAPVTADIVLYADWEAVPVDENADADADGVPDYLETLYGSSTESLDSDNDGLSDYIEIFKTITNPVMADSDENGIPDGGEDTDLDGLTNLQEIQLGTDLTKADTDSDGLTDAEECGVYMTNPLSGDSDSDGAWDGLEIDLGTDPLAANDSFTVTENAENNGDAVTVSVNATLSGAQIETISIEVLDNDILFPENMPGYMGKAYTFDVEGVPEAAAISFTFDTASLNEGAQPTIFRYDGNTHLLEPLKTTVSGNTASVAAEPSATYMLIDHTAFQGARNWEEAWVVSEPYAKAEIVLVIDNSAAMNALDEENLRMAVTQNLIDNLPLGSKIGTVWAGSGTELQLQSMTTDKEAAKAFQTSSANAAGESYMQNAIKGGFTLFEDTESDVLRIMVVLSGNSGETGLHTAALAAASEKNVRIYTVGLGSDNTYFTESLKPMAETTGGTFYGVEEAIELEAIFRKINKQIDLNIDSDGDTIPNYYEDHMFGMNGVQIMLDKYKADTDGDGLADNAELSHQVVYSADGTMAYVVGVMSSAPAETDTDYDGIPDASDKAPSNNQFTGKLTSTYATSSISTSMDYRWFFGDNTVYNNKLSVMSSLLAAAMYEGSSLSLSDSTNTQSTDGKTIQQVMAYFGMSNPQSYSLNTLYSDDHLSEVALGYRTVTVNGVQKTVLAVVVRGTNGTIQEWTSNFDVGQLSTDTASDDWTNTENHKGFDITANRITKLVEQYISQNGISKSSLVYWVTGHSRGAAIANIIGANLEKSGCTAFTYTFAAPNTTLAADAKSYKTIFNIINADDFVPCLPMAAWGYTRYGRSTQGVSIASSYESTWEKTTGIWDYNPDTLGMQDSVDKMGKILQTGKDSRVSLYTYTCDCSYSNHKGDATLDTITHTFSLSSTTNRTKEQAKIPANALPYCFLYEYKSGWFNPYKYDQCQSPAYFMQVLAAMMGGEISAYRFAIELNIAKRYEDAKGALVSAYLGGIEHPHYTESYYVLANNIDASVFE